MILLIYMSLNNDLIKGQCHCGNITLEFKASKPIDQLFVRHCTCDFCEKQNATYTSDPNGSAEIKVNDSSNLIKYQFGHKTADFLSCKNCGSYLGAYMLIEDTGYSVLNINFFDNKKDFRNIEEISYEGEEIEDRLTRRKSRWTPAKIIIKE